jgi:SPP1 gp7 family putative phage head morphogenesis protein
MQFRKRTNAYWRRRAEEQLTLVEQLSLPYLKQIDRAYLDARRANLAAVKSLYVNYYKKAGFDVSALSQIAPAGDVRRFQEAVRALGLSSQLPAGYGFRLTRLELVEANIWLEVKRAGLLQVGLQTEAHRLAYETAYRHAIYTLSKGTGVLPIFSTPNQRMVDRVLNARFMGRNYSERVWRSTDKLAANLRGILVSAQQSGQSYTKTAKLVRERYGVSRYEAVRLVQTETARFSTQASQDSYANIGIDQWVYLATLDSRTSDECGFHDNKVYPVGGGPTIPLHPNCRCTETAWLGQEYEADERIMRDPETGRNRYISNISFEQWQKLYL